MFVLYVSIRQQLAGYSHWPACTGVSSWGFGLTSGKHDIDSVKIIIIAYLKQP